MGEFAIGQGVSRFEDPRLIQGGGRYTDDVKLPGMAHGVVLRSPHAHAKIKSIDTTAAKAAPGVLCVLTSADVKAAGFGDLPVPGGLKRRDGSPQYKPRYPILAEDRVRWLGDSVAFVVAETVAQAHRRRRTDSSRLRAVARRHLHRRGAETGRAARLGRLPRQYLLRRTDRRQGRDRCRLCARGAHRQASLCHQPGHRRDHGAARRGRRLSCRRQALHALHRLAAPASGARRSRQGAESHREQDPHRHRRHRRQLRHEVADLQRNPAGAVGVQAHRPAGEMDQHALGSLPERRAGARQRHRSRTRARQGRHVPGASA